MEQEHLARKALKAERQQRNETSSKLSKPVSKQFLRSGRTRGERDQQQEQQREGATEARVPEATATRSYQSSNKRRSRSGRTRSSGDCRRNCRVLHLEIGSRDRRDEEVGDSRWLTCFKGRLIPSCIDVVFQLRHYRVNSSFFRCYWSLSVTYISSTGGISSPCWRWFARLSHSFKSCGPKLLVVSPQAKSSSLQEKGGIAWALVVPLVALLWLSALRVDGGAGPYDRCGWRPDARTVHCRFPFRPTSPPPTPNASSPSSSTPTPTHRRATRAPSPGPPPSAG